MSDFELTIGAKNEASRVLREFAEETRRVSEQVSLSWRGVAQVFAIDAFQSVFVSGSKAAMEFADSSMKAFDNLEKSVDHFKSNLSIFGQGQGSLLEFAKELEKVTTIDQAKLLNTMSSALGRGAQADELDDMLKAAIGMAEIYNTDLPSGLAKVESAMNGNLGAFASLLEFQEAAQQGFEKHIADSEKGYAAFDKMAVSVRNLKTAFGEVMAPLRDAAFTGIANLADSITSWLLPAFDELEGFSKQTLAGTSDGIANFTEFTIKSFAHIEASFKSMDKAFEMAALSIAIQIEKLGSSFETLGYYFETTWKGAADMAMVSSTMTRNVSQNIGNFAWRVSEGASIGWEGTRDWDNTLRKNLLELFSPLRENVAKVTQGRDEVIPGTNMAMWMLGWGGDRSTPMAGADELSNNIPIARLTNWIKSLATGASQLSDIKLPDFSKLNPYNDAGFAERQAERDARARAIKGTAGPFKGLFEGFESMFDYLPLTEPSKNKSETQKSLEKMLEKAAADWAKVYQDALDFRMNNLPDFDKTGRMLRDKIELPNRNQRGGMGSDADQILQAFQSEVMRYSPRAADRDKQIEILEQQKRNQERIIAELQEANRANKKGHKLQMVNIP